MYIDVLLPSLNIFEENQFYELKNETFNSVNLWLSLYKKGKNEEEWTLRMKSIFLGAWIYKCELLQLLTEQVIEICFEK